MSDIEIDLTINETQPIELEFQSSEPTFDLEFAEHVIINQGGAKIETDFSFTDFQNDKKIIGLILPSRVPRVVIMVDEAFNEGTLVIGDEDAHGRIVAANEVDLTHAKKYVLEPDVEYESNTQIYIYFETGAPSAGSGTIIVYYQ